MADIGEIEHRDKEVRREESNARGMGKTKERTKERMVSHPSAGASSASLRGVFLPADFCRGDLREILCGRISCMDAVISAYAIYSTYW